MAFREEVGIFGLRRVPALVFARGGGPQASLGPADGHTGRPCSRRREMFLDVEWNGNALGVPRMHLEPLFTAAGPTRLRCNMEGGGIDH